MRLKNKDGKKDMLDMQIQFTEMCKALGDDKLEQAFRFGYHLGIDHAQKIVRGYKIR